MSETTQDSVNARIMQALHPTWTNMGGYFNDGAGHGYVTPDCEHSVDACLAVLPEPDDERGCSVELAHRWKGKYQAVIRDYAVVDNINSHAYVGEGATRAEALAHALLAYLTSAAERTDAT